MSLRRWVIEQARRAGLRRPHKRLRYPAGHFGSGLGDGAWLLFGLVHALRPSVCVEIGSARGQSACYVGMALRQLGRGTLYAIDPHEHTAWNDAGSITTDVDMERNLRALKVDGCVQIIRQYSDTAAKAWDRPIDMLFIDGDH